MMEVKNFFRRFLDGTLDLIYSPKKKYVKWLMVLVGIGFILRLIAALNLNVLADDMVFASQSAGIWNAKLLSTNSAPPLFFYLTDLSYKIFGYTTFASRFWPLITGTLMIILVFLITKKLFNNEKIALAAAFFATFSNFLVRMTFSEQSLVVFFFSFLGIYLGILYLEKRELKYLVISGVGFGLALLTKYNAPFFITAYLVFSAFYLKKKGEVVFSKKNIKHLIIFLLVLFVFALPFLSFNYFIYKESGLVDVYFSRIIHVEKAQEVYGSLAGQENSFFNNLFKFSNYGNYKLLYKTDLALLVFGLIGLGAFVKRRKSTALWFFLIVLLIPFVLQSAGAPLQKHFAFMPFLFSIPAGYGFLALTEKFGEKKKLIRFILIAVLLVFMLVGLGVAHGTPPNYLSQGEVSQLKTFINENVKENDLIVFDSRIYTSQIFWLATDKHFITLTKFPEFYGLDQQIPAEQKAPTTIYVVECEIDDCGWGWVANDQNFNQTNEIIMNGVKEQFQLIDTISSYDFKGNEIIGEREKTNKYKVYSISTRLNPNMVNGVDSLNEFYYVPYLYKNMGNYLYNYQIWGLDLLLHKACLLIIYLSVLLSFVMVGKTLLMPFEKD